MSERRRTPTRRIIRPAVLATTLAGGVVATALAQRRHLKTLASDDEFRALSRPLADAVSEHAVLSIDSADGTVIHAERFGPAQGNATLVLAHGWTEAIPYWGPVIRRLASEGLTLVAYDLRGHGQSELAKDNDYGLERFGEDLEAVLAAAGGEPARTAVAGHSLGAMSIAAWAESHDVTGRIGGSAMINTGLSNLLGGALVLGEIGSRLAPEWVSRGLLGSGRPLLPVSTPLSLAIARHVAFGPDASAGTIAFYERMLMSTDAGVRGAVGITLSDLDLLQAAARITVPTIVIAGDSDRLTPAVHAERIARALPSPAGLTILDRTGHMSPLERPDEVASALRTLLAGMRARHARSRAGTHRGGRLMAGSPASVCYPLQEDSELAEAIDPGHRAAAVGALAARELDVPPGAWAGDPLVIDGGVGLLVLEGVLLRRVGIGGRFSAELLGEGDILRNVGEEALSPLPMSHAWLILEPTRLAVLDERFVRQLAAFPRLAGRLFGRSVLRSRQLAVNMAIVHQARVDVRLHMLLWHLAGRWGRVRSDGVLVPLRLTHAILADLVAARRPTVTSALSELGREGLVQSIQEGWLLSGEPPGETGRNGASAG